MYFRFTVAIALLTAIAVIGISVQKQNLALKRHISLQQYQLELLREEEARLRLDVQRLQAPERLQQLERRIGAPQDNAHAALAPGAVP